MPTSRGTSKAPESAVLTQLQAKQRERLRRAETLGSALAACASAETATLRTFFETRAIQPFFALPREDPRRARR